jgi:chromosome segregation ATPase
MASAKTKETYKLDRVLLRNFKSYAGDQEIGPFSTFSSIVGPNGAGFMQIVLDVQTKTDIFSGKSNILDAICFVFCLDMQAIRIKSFSQLVHTGPSHTGESTFVRVIFSSSDGEELAFEREIVLKDTDTDGVKDATTIDRVDGTRLKLSDYVLNLKEIGIDPEAKNFLVQQVGFDHDVLP